jgi:two-component system invasion response regulator UvrY
MLYFTPILSFVSLYQQNRKTMKNEKKVILMVDHSLLVLERMIPILEALPNVQFVLHAGTYWEAVGLLGNQKPDLLLMDIALPDNSGIELLRLVKEKYNNIIVFINTNMVSDQHSSFCRKLGASRFFDKSADQEQMMEAITSNY